MLLGLMYSLVAKLMDRKTNIYPDPDRQTDRPNPRQTDRQKQTNERQEAGQFLDKRSKTHSNKKADKSLSAGVMAYT